MAYIAKYGLGAVDPSTCDPKTQYFDSEYTQTCRLFSDVGPNQGPKPFVGPSITTIAAVAGVGVLAYMMLKGKK